MKHLILLFTAFLFINCSNDDNNNQPIPVTVNTAIVGKWQEQPVNTSCSQSEEVEFFATGTVTSLDLITPPCGYELGSATYNIQSSVLEVNIPDSSHSDGIYTIRYNILTVDATTLIVQPFYNDDVGTYSNLTEQFTYLRI